MTGLDATIDGLHRLCTDVGQISSMVDEILSWLQRALDSVQQLDGPRARTAETQIRAAQGALREVRAVWLDDYVRRSEDLCGRIAS